VANAYAGEGWVFLSTVMLGHNGRHSRGNMTRGSYAIISDRGRVNISIWVVGKWHLRVKGAVKLQSGAVIGGSSCGQGNTCNRVWCSKRPVRDSRSCRRCYQRRGLGVGPNIITKGSPSRTSMQKVSSRVARKSLGHITEIRDLWHSRLGHSI